MGTLNEFTVAFDEGKVIGVIQEIIDVCKMPTRGMVVCDSDP
jgi:hypothetical protein